MEHTEVKTSATAATTMGPFVGNSVSDGVRVVVMTLGWAAWVNGVFGNVLIITTLLSQPSLRSLHSLYIGNLAVADLVVVGYCLPFWLLDLALGHHPVLNQWHCNANGFLMVFCLNASIYTLVLIGFNRYLSVCRPSFYAKFFSRTSIIASCVGVWVVCACECVLPLFHVLDTAFVYSHLARLCIFNGKTSDNLFSIISIANILVSTFLIGFFSLSIYRYWKRSKSRVGQWSQQQNGQAPKSSSRLSSANMALIRSLVLVFALLVLLYIPITVAVGITGRVSVSSDVFSVFVLLLYCNHSINWIVYGVLNKNFKNGYRRLLVGHCSGSPVSAETEGALHTVGTLQ